MLLTLPKTPMITFGSLRDRPSGKVWWPISTCSIVAPIASSFFWAQSIIFWHSGLASGQAETLLMATASRRVSIYLSLLASICLHSKRTKKAQECKCKTASSSKRQTATYANNFCKGAGKFWSLMTDFFITELFKDSKETKLKAYWYSNRIGTDKELRWPNFFKTVSRGRKLNEIWI